MVDTLSPERQEDRTFARNAFARVRRMEVWLSDHGVVMTSERGNYSAPDPWRLRLLAEQLIEAVDKGKL
jgi:tmRNA-binding protein